MSALLPTLGAALVAGLLGSAHCFGMCSGISGLVAVNAAAASLRSRLPLALVYNLGRILSYSVLGLLVAALGSRAVAAIPDLATPVRLLSGVLIVLIGVQIAFDWRFLQPLERAGSGLWQGIAPVARSLLPADTWPRALGLGLVWGWLPCGLVYSVLLLAAASRRPTDGALVMLAFGLGTLPAMVATGLGAARLSQFLSRHSARLGLGALIILLGLLTLALPMSSLLRGEAHHHSMQPPESDRRSHADPT